MPNRLYLLPEDELTFDKNTSLRATIQLVPFIGHAIDTIYGGMWEARRERKLLIFFKALALDLAHAEVKLSQLDPAELEAHIFDSMESAARARTNAKIERLAKIVAQQLTEPRHWREADVALRFASELEDMHIEVLDAAGGAPICDGPFKDQRVVSAGTVSVDFGPTVKQRPSALVELLPNYSEMAIRTAFAELIARGLVRDESIGRMDAKAMQWIVITETGEWFLQWLKARP